MSGGPAISRRPVLTRVLAGMLVLMTAAASTSAADAAVVSAAAGDGGRPYSRVHLQRWTATITASHTQVDPRVVDSWRWRHDLNGSGLLKQTRSAPVPYPPGALPLWNDTLRIPADTAGLVHLLTAANDGVPSTGPAPLDIAARLADLLGVYCPTAAQRAAIVALLTATLGPPTSAGPDAARYAATADNTRWDLVVDTRSNALLTVQLATALREGDMLLHRTTFLSCDHTTSPDWSTEEGAA